MVSKAISSTWCETETKFETSYLELKLLFSLEIYLTSTLRHEDILSPSLGYYSVHLLPLKLHIQLSIFEFAQASRWDSV